MIKRPLVWILGAYLAGIYLAWKSISLLLILLFVFLSFLTIYLILFCIPQSLFNNQDRFLWIIPIIFLLGFISMKDQLVLPELSHRFNDKLSCELSGEITMLVEKQESMALYLKNCRVSLRKGESYLCENIMVYSKELKYYQIGNQVTVVGTLFKFTSATNPGQFNEELYYRIENIDFKMRAEKIIITDASYSRYRSCLNEIKKRLILVYDSILDRKESGALIAMLLGEKFLLDEEIKQLYQENGIAHLLAISGLHISLLGMAIFRLLKWLKTPKTIAIFCSIFFIYSYGVLTNFSVSTNRSIVMMTILLLSGLFGKTYDMLSATALSAFLVLLQNPLQLFGAGFLLSYGAVLGIAVLLPCFTTLFPKKSPLLSGLYISTCASAGTMPIILYFYYQFPLYGLLVNLMILPFVTMQVITSIFAGFAGMIWFPLGVFLIGGTNYILKLYEGICSLSSHLPGNLITPGKPNELQLLLYVVILIFFVWTANRYKKWFSAALIPIASLVLLLPDHYNGLEITFLDVGQGDAIVMQKEGETVYLVDGGSADIKQLGEYRLEPFLKYQGISRIDYVFLTHADSDHTNGVKELIERENIMIGNLVLPMIQNKEDEYLQLEELAEMKHIPITYLQQGDLLEDGDLSLLSLNPDPSKNYASVNAYSTVLSVTYGEFDLLLTGDLEQKGEESVMDFLQAAEYQAEKFRVPITDYDILKVAHHGSKYSTTTTLLELIRPELSIISCGKDNYYGHPHAELLDRLYQAESNIKITYETGAITIRTDGEKLETEEQQSKSTSR